MSTLPISAKDAPVEEAIPESPSTLFSNSPGVVQLDIVRITQIELVSQLAKEQREFKALFDGLSGDTMLYAACVVQALNKLDEGGAWAGKDGFPGSRKALENEVESGKLQEIESACAKIKHKFELMKITAKSLVRRIESEEYLRTFNNNGLTSTPGNSASGHFYTHKEQLNIANSILDVLADTQAGDDYLKRYATSEVDDPALLPVFHPKRFRIEIPPTPERPRPEIRPVFDLSTVATDNYDPVKKEYKVDKGAIAKFTADSTVAFYLKYHAYTISQLVEPVSTAAKTKAIKAALSDTLEVLGEKGLVKESDDIVKAWATISTGDVSGQIKEAIRKRQPVVGTAATAVLGMIGIAVALQKMNSVGNDASKQATAYFETSKEIMGFVSAASESVEIIVKRYGSSQSSELTTFLGEVGKTLGLFASALDVGLSAQELIDDYMTNVDQLPVSSIKLIGALTGFGIAVASRAGIIALTPGGQMLAFAILAGLALTGIVLSIFLQDSYLEEWLNKSVYGTGHDLSNHDDPDNLDYGFSAPDGQGLKTTIGAYIRIFLGIQVKVETITSEHLNTRAIRVFITSKCPLPAGTHIALTQASKGDGTVWKHSGAEFSLTGTPGMRSVFKQDEKISATAEEIHQIDPNAGLDVEVCKRVVYLEGGDAVNADDVYITATITMSDQGLIGFLRMIFSEATKVPMRHIPYSQPLVVRVTSKSEKA